MRCACLLAVLAATLLSVVAAAATAATDFNALVAPTIAVKDKIAQVHRHRTMHTQAHEPAAPILDSITASGGCFAVKGE